MFIQNMLNLKKKDSSAKENKRLSTEEVELQRALHDNVQADITSTVKTI